MEIVYDKIGSKLGFSVIEGQKYCFENDRIHVHRPEKAKGSYFEIASKYWYGGDISLDKNSGTHNNMQCSAET